MKHKLNSILEGKRPPTTDEVKVAFKYYSQEPTEANRQIMLEIINKFSIWSPRAARMLIDIINDYILVPRIGNEKQAAT